MRTKHCAECNEVFAPEFSNSQVCSAKCRKHSRRKSSRIHREQNIERIREKEIAWYYTQPKKGPFRENRECIKCKEEYTAKSSRTKYCTECRRKEIAARSNRNHHKNKDKSLERGRKWREENPDYQGQWRKENLEHCNEYAKKYMKENPEVFKKSRRKQCQRTDPNYKIARNIRSRVHKALKRQRASARDSVLKHLGCTISELKQHLEDQFQIGMTWDNYKPDGWHVDHIKPLARFDLADEEQLKEACCYTNLQPLWAKDNLKKGCK